MSTELVEVDIDVIQPRWLSLPKPEVDIDVIQPRWLSLPKPEVEVRNLVVLINTPS